MSMNMRKLPALGDTLRYWGIGDDYAPPDEIRSDICENPVKAAAHVETYLRNMEIAIRGYYRIKPYEENRNG